MQAASRGKPLLTGIGYIDPTVFIDDDSQAYMYRGNPNLWHVKLNDDMVSYDQEFGIKTEDLRDDNFALFNRNIYEPFTIVASHFCFLFRVWTEY
jgi:arabinoxylan arabinofuranohydrolase